MRTDYWEKIRLIFFFTIHKISIFSSTITSELITLFLMELILRYEKTTLLRSEFRKRFKVTLIFSSHSRLMVDASIRGPSDLLNLLSTR